MEQLSGGLTLHLPRGIFPLSTDSMVLAYFARLPRSARVLDLGSGGGTLGLLLCAEDRSCHVTGIEIDPDAHKAALDNLARNGLNGRMESICGDLTTVPSLFSPGSFTCCISNPPYFAGGFASHRNALARQEQGCTPDALMHAAAWALKFGGDFFLVHKPERLAELIAAASREHLELKRLCLLRHSAGSEISLVLLQLRKGARPGMKLEELILRDSSGNVTEDYRKIYHIEEA